GDQTKLRLRLLGNDGFLWGEADEAIGGGFRLPAAPTWTERRALPVVPGTPAGNYRVEAQLYRESGSGTDPIGTLELGSIAIAASDKFWSGGIAGFSALNASAAGWDLIGWAGPQRRETGERAYATTVWRSGGGSGDRE